MKIISKFTISLILIFIPTIFYVIAIYHKLLFTRHDSDSLLFTAVFQDIITKTDLRGWATSNATGYFPDGLIFMIYHLLINNWSTALLASNITFPLLLIAGVLIMNKLYGNRKCILVGGGILFIFNVILYEMLTHKSDLVFLNLTRHAHVGMLFVIFMSLGLLFKLLEKRSTTRSVLMFTLILLGSLSDFLFQITFTLPIIITLSILSIYAKDTISLRNVLFILTLILSAALTGFLINSLLAKHFFYYTPSGTSEIIAQAKFHINWHQLPSTIHTALFEISSYWFKINPVFLSISILSFVYVTTRFIKKLSQNTLLCNKESTLILFALFCCICNIGVALVTDHLRTREHLRFIYAGLLLPFISLLILLQAKINSGKILIKSALALIFCLNITIPLITTLSIIKRNMNAKDYHYPTIAACLDKEKETYKLEDGFSEYWKTRLINMYSKKGVLVNALNGSDLTIYFCINNLKHYENKNYNFIVIDKIGKESYISKETVTRFIGPPDDHFNCDKFTDVYIYKKNQLNNWFKEISAKYPRVFSK